MFRTLSLAAGASLALSVAALAAPNCTGDAHLIQWPTGDPVWQMCALAPSDSTGFDGSGLEIYDVEYNGHRVLERAHAPVLNVLYAAGCGCFRDWSDSEVRFSVDTVSCPTTPTGGYAEANTPPMTVCESGGTGGDIGCFRGVAAEKATHLELTTQFQAGWYRYTMRWRFAQDGTITATFGFAAVTASCVSFDHTHHNYWRLDFDIDNPKGDSIWRGAPPPTGGRGSGPVVTETRGNWSPTSDFSVVDTGSNRGYRILPGNTNAPDAFSFNDYWFLRYKPTEMEDTSGGCATQINGFVNNETLQDQDVVVWVRGGAFHQGMELDHCGVVGFTLVPFGDWNP
jgi:hypothetical protein